MPAKESWAHYGDLSASEMRQHLNLGRSVLVSPKYEHEYDSRGNVLNVTEVSPAKHIVHPSQVEDPTALTLAAPTPKTGADIDAEIARLQEQRAHLEPAEKKVEDPTKPVEPEPKAKNGK
jgi:hypothetical protein